MDSFNSNEDDKEKKSNKERSRRARVWKKRYIEDLEGRVNALEEENQKLKEKLELFEQKLLVKEHGSMKERYE